MPVPVTGLAHQPGQSTPHELLYHRWAGLQQTALSCAFACGYRVNAWIDGEFRVAP
jgi:hypothetical protein